MLLIVSIAAFAVVASIGLHYLALFSATRALAHFHNAHLTSTIIVLFLAVIAHLLEIIIFAVSWQIMYSMDLITFSVASPGFIDLVYFSGTTYTTVGYGDIILTGDGRIMAVVEGVVGLVLIAWTASFTYCEMNKEWLKS